MRNYSSVDTLGSLVSGSYKLVAKIAIPIKPGHCQDTSNVSWRGYASATKAQGVLRRDNGTIWLSSNISQLVSSLVFPLHYELGEPVISAEAKPNGILYRWSPVENAVGYGFALNGTSNWIDTISATRNYLFIPLAFGDSTSFALRALGGCDTAYSDTLGKKTIPCTTITSNVVASASSICAGIPLTVTANHTYANGLVSFDGGLTFVTKKDSVFSLIKSDTTINVMVKDSFGCSSAIIPITVTLKTSVVPTAEIAAINTNSCTNQSIILNGTATGGTEQNPLTILWTTTGLGVISNANTLNATYTPSPLDAGNIEFKLSASNECKNTEVTTSTTMTFSPDAGVVYYVQSSDGSKYFSPAKSFVTEPVYFEIQNASSAAKYRWSFGTGNVADTSVNANTSFAFTAAGTYQVKVKVSNIDGSVPACPDSTIITIVVEKSNSLYVPNVFSPYATNAADRTLRVFGYIAADGFEMVVYNRWGAEVFKTSDVTEAKKGWNGGKDNGSELPQGTYTYSIKGKFLDGTSFDKVGTVALIR
ncbi:T9SS type B sorting domain-containing protein [Flexibacter flexilis]|uniref:T9SS type B sorting domain-containing protein n=1 Tax=Flexibacter flexilis TaxID=998 RepID=UPI0015A61C42|nr:gliding motility-associated C-terminal domain-containing protein [Flexibacter flexilis]